VYIPAPFREDRLDVLHEIIRQYSFATLVSTGSSGLIATHLPLLLDASRGAKGTLIGHVARENTHWQLFRDSPDVETLVLFQGPHAYISPTWYKTPYAVPTWNYEAVHAYGRPKLIEDQKALFGIVAELVRVHEARFEYSWDLDAHREYADKLLKNIVGFEFEITRLEGKRKLSQNRSRADQEGAIAGLTEQADPLGMALASLMEERVRLDKAISRQT
jgi:transcriptional regulator